MTRQEALKLWGEVLDGVPMAEALEEFATRVEKATQAACKAEIDKWIEPGELHGNGWDQTAQRNGMILASNLLHDMMTRFNGWVQAADEGSRVRNDELGAVSPAPTFKESTK